MLWADRLVVLVSVLWRDLHTDSWRSVPICILTSSRWGVPFPVIFVSMYSHLGFLMVALVTGSKGLSSSFNLPFPGGGEGCWGVAKILHGRLCSFSEELYSVHWGPTYSLDDWGCLIFISILSDVGNKDFLGGKTLLRSGSGFLGKPFHFMQPFVNSVLMEYLFQGYLACACILKCFSRLSLQSFRSHDNFSNPFSTEFPLDERCGGHSFGFSEQQPLCSCCLLPVEAVIVSQRMLLKGTILKPQTATAVRASSRDLHCSRRCACLLCTPIVLILSYNLISGIVISPQDSYACWAFLCFLMNLKIFFFF